MNLPSSRRLSAKRLATRKWLTPSLSVLVALLFAGVPALRHAEFSRRVSAQNKPVPLEYVVNSTADGGGNVGPDTTCADSLGRCTLRAAIEASNSHLPPDFISFNIPTSDPGFDPSTGIYTINLNQGLPDLTNSVIITGPGADKLTVQRNAGGGFYRIFNVTTTGSVDLSGLTLARGLIGLNADDDGGGIQNLNAGTVNVTNCTVSGNSASSGGGISNMSTGTVNVSNSTITGNSTNVIFDDTKFGGGIYNHGTGPVNVTNSTITGNSATSGGGISNGAGTVTVANSTLSSNSADSINGGGISNGAGTVTVANSTIGSNTGGGISGIFQGVGTMTVLGSTLSGNTGGGISFAGTLTVTDCTISNNKSNNFGGGGGISNSGHAIVSNSTINGNSTSGLGGGIFNGLFNGARLEVFNSTISGNSASRPDNGAGNAGGIYNASNSGGLTVANSTISGNTSPVTGGIFSSSNDVQVKSTIVALNTASSSTADVLGSFVSFGFNLIGKKDGSTGFTAAGDQTGTVASPLDPKLDPNGLQNNGGPTKTIALLFGSPAIDKGTSAGVPGNTNDLTTDQRGTGFPRTFNDPNVPNAAGGDGTDIGAFEVQLAGPTPTPTPPPMTIQFSASSYTVGEGDKRVDTTITRSGDTSGAASVSFATSDLAGAQNCKVKNGVASSRCDYEARFATVKFAPGETSKTISVFIIDDSYLEGPEVFYVNLSNPIGASLGTPATATVTIIDNDLADGPNPIDTPGFYVRLHYLDFLSREPDQSGLDFWTGNITSCGADQQCIDVKRINVSAAFYLSIEFQQTGYLVERIYKAAYGDASGPSALGNPHQLAVPIVRLNEFLLDTQQMGQGVVVGQAGWEMVLENNKQAYAADFVQRSRFTNAFATVLTPAQFVDTLFVNAGVTPLPSDRNAAINEFSGASDSSNLNARARALREVAENSSLNQHEFNRAFVLMQFFGYLRRNPNDPQDSDYTGYDFWLTKLNQFNGNFVDAEMVRAFITSVEYRQRLGP